jgi:tRNA-Thr(GGU) m(6)t(6)A37 methyltransferase TsaA
MDQISYKPIGIIHSPFKEPKGTPIQPTAGHSADGTVELFPEYAGGLEDLDGFSHVFLIYHFHRSKESSLKVRPFMDDQTRGVFSTRAPDRPNPIGISEVQLLKIEGNVLHVRELDILDGTPLLDIKPYVPEFDAREATKRGWLAGKIKNLSRSSDDGRFMK